MNQAQQDHEHLKLLSIFHYVVAGLAALFACFPIIHLTLGISMLTGSFGDPSMQGPPRLVGLLFVLIPGAIILTGWGYAVAMAIAGRFLAQQRNRLFCLVMAGISCAFMPFGTVLGVFTIIVLMRPSVQALFADGEQPDKDDEATASWATE